MELVRPEGGTAEALPVTDGSSQAWLDRYARSVMQTFGTPQRVLVRGEGPYVWDADGNRYLDLLGGIATNSLGHAHPLLVAAVTAQLTTLGHVSNFFASAPQVALAERLLQVAGAPQGSAVFFANSGAEANEAAFKMTRRTGRTKVVSTLGAFHGRTMGALALTAKEAYRAPFEPLPGGVEFVPYGDLGALGRAVDGATAAVFLEPLQGENGVVPAPDGYLAGARRITAEHGALLVLDEVQTGIGRTGEWFAFQNPRHEGVVPDVVTVAKGLAAASPSAASSPSARPTPPCWGPASTARPSAGTPSRPPPAWPCCTRWSATGCWRTSGPWARTCAPPCSRWGTPSSRACAGRACCSAWR